MKFMVCGQVVIDVKLIVISPRKFAAGIRDCVKMFVGTLTTTIKDNL